ncbi:MAG: EVE domain-containing protein [Candidatus Solibacter sp.]|nr:EVE domain-containing protein [Candidatus Solibacter sp.]
MAKSYFLAKTEPGTYSIEQFAAEGRTDWDGVRNAQALQAVKAMKPGDGVWIYHSGGVSAVAGMARVAGKPEPDPDDAKSWRVAMEFVTMIDPPVTLAEIKASGLFEDWALVRQSRLSTMAAPESFVDWMRAKYPRLKI